MGFLLLSSVSYCVDLNSLCASHAVGRYEVTSQIRERGSFIADFMFGSHQRYRFGSVTNGKTVLLRAPRNRAIPKLDTVTPPIRLPQGQILVRGKGSEDHQLLSEDHAWYLYSPQGHFIQRFWLDPKNVTSLALAPNGDVVFISYDPEIERAVLHTVHESEHRLKILDRIVGWAATDPEGLISFVRYQDNLIFVMGSQRQAKGVRVLSVHLGETPRTTSLEVSFPRAADYWAVDMQLTQNRIDLRLPIERDRPLAYMLGGLAVGGPIGAVLGAWAGHFPTAEAHVQLAVDSVGTLTRIWEPAAETDPE